MWDEPNPVLNDEELALLVQKPEECMRRAINRAALSLDQVTGELSAQVAAAVCGIVTGERPSAPTASESTRSTPSALFDRIGGRIKEQQRPGWTPAQAHDWLVRFYPWLDNLMTDELLTPDEAMEAAHAVDGALGRYPTGCRYAAP